MLFPSEILIGSEMLRRAFTMLELVFVIVVVGILAISIIPRLERDNVGEAAYQIARHIRLAQHHALVEDHFDNTSDWKKKMWRIAFTHSNPHNGDCYDVFSDRNKAGNVDSTEAAIDPLTKKSLFSSNCADGSNYNEDVLLWKKYGVDSVSFSAGCSPATGSPNKYIAFDHLGRPYSKIGEYLNGDCVISITTSDNHSAEVTIYEESGFVKVTKIDSVVL